MTNRFKWVQSIKKVVTLFTLNNLFNYLWNVCYLQSSKQYKLCFLEAQKLFNSNNHLTFLCCFPICKTKIFIPIL